MAKELIILVQGVWSRNSAEAIYPKMETLNSHLITGAKRRWYMRSFDLNNKVIIRWGATIELNVPDSVEYNGAGAIKRASNKKLTRQLLFESDVRAPRMVSPSSDNISYPVIARPRYHSIGRNFVTLNDIDELTDHYSLHEPEGWYYSEYIDKVQEFRVHVGHGKILSILEKNKPVDEDELIWNIAHTGLPQQLVDPDDYNIDVVVESIKAVDAVGLDFAGVDVVVDADGLVYILEINTMPIMTSAGNSQKIYAQYFDWLAASDTHRPHFDVESENAADYVWAQSDFEDR